MKMLIAVLAAAAVLVGCATNNDTQQVACDNAQKAYVAYQALVASGAEVDADTIATVKIAASVLSMYCGWTPVATGIIGVKDGRATVFDSNGVPILHQP